MILEIRSINFCNLATLTLTNHKALKCWFSVKKIIHALLLPSREHRFHPKQCKRYLRKLWKGINLEMVKTDTPHRSHNLREWRTLNSLTKNTDPSKSRKVAYFILNEQLRGSSINGNIFQKAAEGTRLTRKGQ